MVLAALSGFAAPRDSWVGAGLLEHFSYQRLTARADNFDHPANCTPGKQLLAMGTAQGHKNFRMPTGILEEATEFSLQLLSPSRFNRRHCSSSTSYIGEIGRSFTDLSLVAAAFSQVVSYFQ
jgi:hypothetical protein